VVNHGFLAQYRAMDNHTTLGRVSESTPLRVVGVRVGLKERLVNLWDRRDLIGALAISDIRVKYKGSVLGFFWSMLSPAMTLGIYFLVFSVFLKNGFPNFVIYLFSGLVVWNFFSTSITTATGSIVDRAGLVKKVAFPREVLALANVGSASVYFAVQLVVLAGCLAAFSHAPAWGFLWLVPLSLLSMLFLVGGLSLILSALTVYLRDIRHLVEIALQVWFWMTPVVYSYKNSIATALHSHGLATLYFLNPVTMIVLTFQRVFYATLSAPSTVAPGVTLHVLPTWPMSTYAYVNAGLVGLSALFFLVCLAIFGRLEGNFESEL